MTVRGKQQRLEEMMRELEAGPSATRSPRRSSKRRAPPRRQLAETRGRRGCEIVLAGVGRRIRADREHRTRHSEGEDRILTAPNLVTRHASPASACSSGCSSGRTTRPLRRCCSRLLGATDWVDGFVARRFHQVSTVGKVLDPVADRMLVATAVICVMIQGAAPLWFGLATIAREVVVSAAVLLLAWLGAERIDVLFVGKAGTFGLMFAYPTFSSLTAHAGWQDPIRVVAWVFAIPGLALAWVAAGRVRPGRSPGAASGRAGRAGGRRGHGGQPTRRRAGGAVRRP